MFDLLAFWKSKGMNPSVIYDVGAHEGSWAEQILKVFPEAHLELFEANRDHLPTIDKYSHHILLLGNESKKNVQYFRNTIGCTTGNSIYLEQTQYFVPGTAVIELLDMYTLDEYTLSKNLKTPDFVKLDVQGAELDILKGMTRLMKDVKYFVIETALHSYNKGAPMAEDIIAFMSANGYAMIDLVELHRINGFLAQVDILFAHKSTGLRKEHFYNENF